MSASNSQDILSTASPIFGYNTFERVEDRQQDEDDDDDDYGLDQSLTEDYRHGITNINYDFDVSDQSAENSVNEPERQDLLTSKMLIEESPKDVLLPSPLQPTAVAPEPAVEEHRSRHRHGHSEPENLFIHK